MIRAATGILAVLVLIAAPASAEWVVESTAPSTGTTNAANDPISITQSADPNTQDNMVACGSSLCYPPDFVETCTTENSWGRLYNLDDAHSINDPLAVQSVDVAHLRSITVTGEPNTLEVNLYTLDEAFPPAGGVIGAANLVLIGQAIEAVPGDGSAEGTFQNIPVAGLVTDTNNNDLFVEQFAPEDGTVEPQRIYRSGGNGAGEFGASYLASASCGITDPTAFANIGFGDIHLVQVVNGKLDTGSTPTEPASWSEIKALYK